MKAHCICIHGHFYQPPRENAWLEAVEVQDSAHPYHDWNRRITAECYGANANARILDADGRIERIVNNYERISFDFGPTLLAWMETNAPAVYRAVLEADCRSRERFAGHGSALAQAYNHMIMPLANRRDKRTQVIWGVKDFVHRFGRRPEGMWLPETAVDLETLAVLAAEGIAFTILDPGQAEAFRGAGETEWTDVSDGSIDPKMPYRQRLPGGGEIAVFFYDGPISQAVAFEDLLNDGTVFADRLIGGFIDGEGPQLVHIATDGESYGHHFTYGDMALAYALHAIESEGRACLTNYGAFLAAHPPTREVRIKENTSWSCRHGIERWRGDCGCNSGHHPGWHQRWRRPLRDAMDWLNQSLADAYAEATGELLKAPRDARDDYIAVVNDRSVETIEDFMRRHCRCARRPADNVRLLKLLEMQRHAMLMQTSCGWFFDEISGIETVQVIQYAGRAIQLYEDLFGADLEKEFLQRLARAESNLAEHGDGRRIYEKWVKPARVDLHRVAAHYAISAVFEDFPETAPVFCCTVTRKSYLNAEAGRARLTAGRLEIASEVTQESENLRFGVFYTGDHQLACGLSGDRHDDDFSRMSGRLFDAFDRADFTAVMRLLDESFGGAIYSFKSLFRDGQRKILHIILDQKVADALSVYRHVYEPNVPLIRFLKDSDTPVPAPLYASGRFVLNGELKNELQRRDLEPEKVKCLLRDAELAGITLDVGTLEYTLRRNMEALADAFHQEPRRRDLLERLVDAVALIYDLPFDVNLRKLQNVHYAVKHSVYPDMRRRADGGDEAGVAWAALFEVLCERLNLKL
jgi:alpha-amylase/alpha-mannosidase (GH57 family)